MSRDRWEVDRWVAGNGEQIDKRGQINGWMDRRVGRWVEG